MADANLNELLASIELLKGSFTEQEKALVLDALVTNAGNLSVIPNLPTVMEQLMEQDAVSMQNFDGLDATLKNEGERQRAWKMGTPDLLDSAAEYLRRYGWVKGANPVPRRFVENPKIDNAELPGKWRVVGTRKMYYQGSYYIIQILRKGYAAEIDWTEAFLVESHSPRTSDEVRIIEFRYFDPVCVEAARAALRSATFSNPVVQSQTLAGNWAASDIIPKPEQDGSYTITLILKNMTGSLFKYRSLASMFRIGNSVVYRNWPNPVEVPLATGSGLYRVQDQLSNDGLYDATLVYECGTGSGQGAFRSMSTMFREGSTILYKSWPTIIYSPVATGSGIYRVQQSMQDDGTYDGALVYECGNSTGRVPFRSLSTMFREGNTILYKSWPAKIDAPAATGSGIYRVQQSLQDDGTYEGALIYECGTSSGQVPFKSLSTMFREGNTILYKSSPEAITSPASTGSGIYRVQQSLQDDGTYDGALVYECGSSTGQVAFRSLSTMFREGNTIIYKAWPTQIEAPSSSGSGIYRAQQTLQDDGTYDGALVYECGTATGSVQFRSFSTMFREGNTILYKAWPTQIIAPSADGGGVYRAQQTLQDDGSYDGSLVYEFGGMSGQVEFRSLSTISRIGSTILYKGFTSSIQAPASTGSGIYRVQQTMQDDGTYDGALVYECGTGSGQAEYRSLSSVFREGTTLIYRSWPTAITAPTAGVGGIYRAQQSIQEDGTYDGVLVYECGPAGGKSVSYQSLQALQRLGSSVLYKSWPTSIEAPAAGPGGIYRVNQTIQDDGTYDGQIVYEARSGKSAQVVSLKSIMTTVTEGLYTGQSSPPVLPAAAQGKIFRIQASISEDGLYDAETSEQEASAKAIFKTWESSNGTCGIYMYRNWGSTVEMSDGSLNVSCSSSMNDDGTYDSLISITPPSVSGYSGDWSDNGNHKTKLYNLYGNKGIGEYLVWVYQRKTYNKAESDVTAKLANPDAGYKVVPSYGAYHTGIWVHGRGAYQGIVVLYKAGT